MDGYLILQHIEYLQNLSEPVTILTLELSKLRTLLPIRRMQKMAEVTIGAIAEIVENSVFIPNQNSLYGIFNETQLNNSKKIS